MEKVKPEVVKGWKKKHKFNISSFVDGGRLYANVGSTIAFVSINHTDGLLTDDYVKMINESASETLEYSKHTLKHEGIKIIVDGTTNKEAIVDLEKSLC